VLLAATVAGCRLGTGTTHKDPRATAAVVKRPTRAKQEGRPAPAVMPREKSTSAPTPRWRRIVARTSLSRARELDHRQRLADLLRQTRRALSMMGCKRLSDVRRKARANAGNRFGWERSRQRTADGGDPVLAQVTIPVWVPRGARQLQAFCGTKTDWKRAERSHANLPRACGSLWLEQRLAVVNDQQAYRPATLTFETYALHAPIAHLLFEYIFREGLHDPARRVPIMAVRSGEDCYSADRAGGPLRAESLSFIGAGHQFGVVRPLYRSAGELLQGCHVHRSSHRIGCALDVNFFWFYHSRDGSTNAITSSARHADRDRMHAIDRRNLPDWIYAAAKAMGYRVPQDWTYLGGRDWPHLDIVGSR